MSRQILVLYQSFWWRHAWLLRISASAILLSQLVFWMGGSWGNENVLLGLAFYGHLFAILAVQVALAGMDVDLSNGRTGFPTWWFNLPARSSLLAAVPIAGMVVSVSLIWLSFSLMLRVGMGESVAFWEPLAAMIGLAAFMQYFSWSPVSHPFKRTVKAGVLMGLLVFFAWLADRLERGTVSLAVLQLALLVFAVTSIGLAFRAAMMARYSAVADSQGTYQAKDRPGELSDFGPFPSPGAAMRWRDWSQVTRHATWFTAFFGVAVLLLSLDSHSLKPLVAMLSVGPFAMFLLGAAAGKSSLWHGTTILPVYLAVLPIPTWQMIMVRVEVILRAALKSSFLTGCLMLVMLGLNPGVLAALRVWAESMNQQFGDGSGVRLGAAALLSSVLLTAFPCFLIFVLNTLGRPKWEAFLGISFGILLSVLLLIPLLWFVTLGDEQTFRHELTKFLTRLPMIVYSVLGLKLLAAVLFWRVARCCTELPFALEWGMLLAYLGLSIAIWGCYRVLVPEEVLVGIPLLGLSALLVPCGSLLFAIGAIQGNRSR